MAGAAKAAMGEYLRQLTPLEGYRAWAPHYDETLNPLLALESRVLSSALEVTKGDRIIDAGCGTGRSMAYLAACGARVFGVDFCDRMLALATAKPGLNSRCVVADISRLPMRDDYFDLALSSFTLSYAPDLSAALAELARVARRVIVADLHPEAVRRGWKRSFRYQESSIEISHSPYTLTQLDDAAHTAGLMCSYRIEASFGEPEREIFRLAGKASGFAEAAGCRALLVTSWVK
jgi:ubiquinone/menaquinone biosynthesis C-methylase UbiE